VPPAAQRKAVRRPKNRVEPKVAEARADLPCRPFRAYAKILPLKPWASVRTATTNVPRYLHVQVTLYRIAFGDRAAAL